MYCPRCGKASKVGERFCAECGLDLSNYRLSAEDAPTGDQVIPAAYEPRYRPPSPYPIFERIPSYLGWAIAVLIVCFWPTGIPAVVYASRVDNLVARGDVTGAREASRRAKMWCWITFGIWVAFWVIGIVFFILALVFLDWGSHFSVGVRS